MLRSCWIVILAAVIANGMLPCLVGAQGHSNVFWLHHSTGRNIIDEGQMREEFAAYNNANGTNYEFWDHDYNYIGLRDPAGSLLGYSYQIPDDNTYPDGLHQLWTTENDARADILFNHQVIAFKSCYPTCHISGQAQLQQYMTYYLDIRDVIEMCPDQIFVVMSPPPLHRLATDLGEADLSRQFANWLESAEYLGGHPNVVCYNLFDVLAHPDDGSDVRNMLRYEFERSHSSSDSHPNANANSIVGPLFCQFIIQATDILSDAGGQSPPAPVRLAQNHPNPFNPTTQVSYFLPSPSLVSLGIYDLTGRLVCQMVDGQRAAGQHAEIWNGRNQQGFAVSSGIYIYRLTAGGTTLTRKMTLAK